MWAPEHTFSRLRHLVPPQSTFFSQILSHAMHVAPAHWLRLGLAFWDGQGDEGNLQCAKCELKSLPSASSTDEWQRDDSSSIAIVPQYHWLTSRMIQSLSLSNNCISFLARRVGHFENCWAEYARETTRGSIPKKHWAVAPLLLMISERRNVVDLDSSYKEIVKSA